MNQLVSFITSYLASFEIKTQLQENQPNIMVQPEHFWPVAYPELFFQPKPLYHLPAPPVIRDE